MLHCDDVIEKVGGNGRYQWTRFLAMLAVYQSNGFLFYSSAFLTLQPELECKTGAGRGGSWAACTKADACENHDAGSRRVDAKNSLANFVTDFGLECEEAINIPFALYRRNFLPLFYVVSEIFLRPRKIPL
jgi:hypothetical protein